MDIQETACAHGPQCRYDTIELFVPRNFRSQNFLLPGTFIPKIHFWTTLCKTVCPMLSYRCLSCPVCDIGVLWPNGWMDQDETRHRGKPRPRRHSVRWGLSSPPQKKGHSPQFLAHVCCGQTAGWIKMPLRTEVGLGQGDTVRWGPSSPPPERGAQQPPQIFGPYLLWPNGWIDQDATWYRGRTQRRPHCVRWGSSSP